MANGTGKNHIATAMGVQAIEHHRRKVRFFSTVELVNALEQEKALEKAGKIAETLTKTDLTRHCPRTVYGWHPLGKWFSTGDCNLA